MYDDPRGAPETYTEVCSPPSSPFLINLEDPCEVTGILSAELDTVMALPQLRSMTLSLADEMPLNTWPWITEVENDVDGSKYGYNLCGELKYDVLLIDESTSPYTKVPTDLVTITPDY